MNTYKISPDGLSITCLKCNRTSYHPRDVSDKYCVNCHIFHDIPDMETHRTKLNFCPVCGYKMDLASSMSDDGVDRHPKSGDIGLCLKCGEILCYNDDMSLRESNLDDILQIPPEVMEVVERYQKLIREKRPIK